ncbi:AraC family transcriptional regulator [Sphingomonas bacterium]|uniref:AraC family transcriptional regulator n=1 Tax=Sphingomonas bacterium TaxID=1895847 RepID=UPI0015768B42|nr:helix-turn-helix transcriptional regulator [Sphingomonas bacterium]
MIGDGFAVRSLALTLRDGSEISAHRHGWGQLVYARSGTIEALTGDGMWFAPATRAIWIPAALDHRLRCRGEVALRTLYLAPGLAAPLSAVGTIEVVPLLRELIVHITRLGMLHPDNPAEARLAAVLVDLLSDARREQLQLPLPRDGRARSVAERLIAAPADQARNATLARDAGASLRSLQRLFLHETGLTLEAWRRQARLLHAITLLTAGDGMVAVALGCGYTSTSAFSAAFRRTFGLAPSSYRGARE